jgi:hypothetical protein
MIKEYLEKRLVDLTKELEKASFHKNDKSQKRHTRDLAREVCVDLEGRKREISTALMFIAELEKEEEETFELRGRVVLDSKHENG